MTEAWLSGPVDGVSAVLMPAAHALLDALHEIEREAADLPPELLWLEPGGAASVGYHIRHARGALDRLLTYARGESLSPGQLAAIPREGESGSPPAGADELLDQLRAGIDAALGELRGTPEKTLAEPRKVGRAGLPSTVHGLLYHAAEHTRRHAGQVVTTVRIVRGLGLAPEKPPS